MIEPALLRIGEVSRRAGVSPELLRAWERRYGLLEPTRSAGGLRLYSPTDVARVRLMRRLIADGLAAAEAAALARGDATLRPADESALAAARSDLRSALDRFDEPGAQAAFDQLLALASVDTLLADVVVPYLQELGARWARGEASIAQEHFASGLLRGRLLGMARGWGQGLGPIAVLACLPGEQHDLGLITFGLALRERGWRIVYIGPDAPIDTVVEIGVRAEPVVVVLSAVSGDRVEPVLPALRELARHRRVALGGAAAQASSDDTGDILRLDGDLLSEAARLTSLVV
jgi:MerR family transcriptional regulator, light-induced transcriptional regulator